MRSPDKTKIPGQAKSKNFLPLASKILASKSEGQVFNEEL